MQPLFEQQPPRPSRERPAASDSGWPVKRKLPLTGHRRSCAVRRSHVAQSHTAAAIDSSSNSTQECGGLFPDLF